MPHWFRPHQLANLDDFEGEKSLNFAHFFKVFDTEEIKPLLEPSLPKFFDQSGKCRRRNNLGKIKTT